MHIVDENYAGERAVDRVRWGKISLALVIKQRFLAVSDPVLPLMTENWQGTKQGEILNFRSNIIRFQAHPLPTPSARHPHPRVPSACAKRAGSVRVEPVIAPGFRSSLVMVHAARHPDRCPISPASSPPSPHAVGAGVHRTYSTLKR